MNRDKYNEAWTNLMAARRRGNLNEIHELAEMLAHAARVLMLEKEEAPFAPCSHFMVVNGHCINCHEEIGVMKN